jgi:hypothetical protein
LELARAADEINKDLPHLGISNINDIDQFMGWAVEGWFTCQILFREANALIAPEKAAMQANAVPSKVPHTI